MRAVAVHFFMKRVVDRDFVVAVVVYSISEQLKPHAMASCNNVFIVSDRGRYCNKGVLSFRRMRVNLFVAGSFESSQMPAHLRTELVRVSQVNLDARGPARLGLSI